MAFRKWPGISFALLFGPSLGAAQAQSSWAPVDGPSPAGVKAVVSLDNVVLASSPHHIFRTLKTEGPWSDSLFPEGVNPDFMQALDSLVFAAQGTTIFRSADRGLTWNRTVETGFSGSPRRIFRSSGSLAMVTTDGRYLSSANQGVTWTAYQQSPSGYAYSQLLLHDSLLFAGTDNGLYVSSNHGANWKRLRSGLPAGQIILLERMLGKLFLGIGGQGLFVSTNLGETWAKVDGGLARARVDYSGGMGMAASGNLLLLASSGPGGVLGSRDSGKTWTPFNQGLPSNRQGGVTLYTNFNIVFQADTAFVSTAVGVYRSTNGGVQWSAVNQGLPPTSDAFLGLGAAGADLYASIYDEEQGHAYRSSDGGRSWKKADSLLDGLRRMRAEEKDWFAITDQGMAHSTDSGKTWASVAGPWKSSQGPIAFDFRGNDLAVAHHFEGATLFCSPDKGETWNAEVESRPTARWGDLHFQAMANRLRISTDGGRTWITQSTVFPEAVIDLKAGTGNLALLSDTSLFVSSDSGRTWKQPSGLMEKLRVNSIAMVGSRLYAATWKGLMLSLDGGMQWKVLAQGLPVADIQALVASEGRLFAADVQGLHLREGSATGWKTINAAPAGIQQLAVWKNGVLAGTQSGRLWMSKDGGTTWASTGDTVSGRPILSLAMGPGLAFVSKSNGLFRTSDSGKTWEPVLSADIIPAPTSIALGNAFLYAASGYNSYRSRDGGLHWSLLPRPRDWVPRYLVAEGGELYGADDNGVHSSQDQGGQWAWASPPIPFNPVVRLAYAGGRVYIAGSGGTGLYVLEQAPTGLLGHAPGVLAEDIRLGRQGGKAVFRWGLPSHGPVGGKIYSATGRHVDTDAMRGVKP